MRCGTGILLAIAVLLVAPRARAQTPTPPSTKQVGFLTPATCPADHPTSMPFVDGLRALGHVDGKGMVLQCRVSNGSAEHYRQLAADLVGHKVDVIFAVSSSAVRAARAETSRIPIVALDLETDPVASGIAASLARPGGNTTGIFQDLPELSAKRLGLLRDALPRLARVAMLWDDAMDRGPLTAAVEQARALGLRAQIATVRSPADFDAAFRAMARERAGAVVVIQSPMLEVRNKEVLDLAFANRLPVVGVFPSFARAGALMTYGPQIEDLFRQSAAFIDKILRGARPGDVPIERPTRFYLYINLKTAKALGLTIPPSLLLRADQVIE
jgi:putative ABC transport system substrate-binding protein